MKCSSEVVEDTKVYTEPGTVHLTKIIIHGGRLPGTGTVLY